ncbi:hypothetical protein VE00_10726 [Pseudogymnoascus sp. WSF 3629]|nr:hypothetical protein VE00_10726 [Pseudogymnoascus sp. WSF 3629]
MCLITTVAFAALLLGQAYAHPALASSRRDLQGRAVDSNAFRLGTKASYGNATYTTGSSVISSLSKRVTYIETAKALVQKVALGFELRVVDDHYVGSNGIAHVNLKQTVHGLDIDNALYSLQ